MAQRRFSVSQLRTGRQVLLLEITWAGETFRFSSEPVALTNQFTNTLRYGGGLSVSSIRENLDRDTISAEDQSISLDLLFPVDVVARVRQLKPLSMARGEMAVVIVQGPHGRATSQQVYEDRFVLFEGSVSEAIIGVPGLSSRFASFSLESDPADDGTPLLDLRTRIDNPDTESGDAKMIPFVFGRPGVYVDSEGNDTAVPGSPAYIYTGTSRPNYKAYIALGTVQATEVTITDNSAAPANFDTYPVEQQVGEAGGSRAFASEDVTKVVFFSETPMWVSWTEKGAMLNPYGDGVLTGLGDLCRFLVSRTGQRADHGAWTSVAPYLNRYRLAGYVNEAETTVWGWLSQFILPIFPGLRIVRGPDGLLPLLYGTDRALDALTAITIGPGFALVSGETETRPAYDLYNDITLEYAFDAKEEKAKKALRVGPEGVEGVDLTSQTATISSRVYGHRIGPTITSRYIYEDATARSVLTDYVTARAFIGSEIEVLASPEWGTLQLGDEFALVSTDLQITKKRAVIIGRSWVVESGQWLFTIWLSPSPLDTAPEI